jgi:hypothetical protein
MEDYWFNVSEVEELQTINDLDELERRFGRARSAIVNGASVILARNQGERLEKFNELTTLEELDQYRTDVFKYLG